MNQLIRRIVLTLILLCSWPSLAAAPPPRPKLPGTAATHIPILIQEQKVYWPDHPYPATQATQIEKESRWKVGAHLKTSREYGFGFGQTTVAYNADGSERFNNWAELKQRYKPELKDWTWDNRLDPRLSLRVTILYDRQLYKQFSPFTPDKEQALKFSYSAYNGGAGGLLGEIKMCKAVKNCDPQSWDSTKTKLGVSAVSKKSRKPFKGYGQSTYDINRAYSTFIFGPAILKYEPYFPSRNEK